jgi:hypothetical protein
MIVQEDKITKRIDGCVFISMPEALDPGPRAEAVAVLERSLERLAKQGEYSHEAYGSGACVNELCLVGQPRVRCAAAIVIDGPMVTACSAADAFDELNLGGSINSATWAKMLRDSGLPDGRHVFMALGDAQKVHDKYANTGDAFGDMLATLRKVIEWYEGK